MKRIFLMILTIFSLSSLSAQCTISGYLSPNAQSFTIYYNFDPSAILPITLNSSQLGTLTLNSHNGNIYLPQAGVTNDNFVFYDANGCYFEENGSSSIPVYWDLMYPYLSNNGNCANVFYNPGEQTVMVNNNYDFFPVFWLINSYLPDGISTTANNYPPQDGLFDNSLNGGGWIECFNTPNIIDYQGGLGVSFHNDAIWQWHLDGVPIPSSNTSLIPATQGGIYECSVQSILYGCMFFSNPNFHYTNTISGSTFVDINNNGNFDGSDRYFPTLVSTNTGLHEYSYGNNFDMAAPMGAHNLQITAPPHFQVSNSHSATFATNTGGFDGNNDLAIIPSATFKDLKIFSFSGQMRPGFNSDLFINVANIGNQDINGIVTVNLDPNFNYISANPTPTTIVGQTLTFNLNTINFLSSTNISITGNLLPSVPLGTILNFSGNVSSSIDNDLTNNSFSNNSTVIGSYDPNDISVSPEGNLSPTQIANAQELIYKIRFQNTGTADAITVILNDTISDLLDLNTLEILGSSHSYKLDLYNNRMIRVMYNDINLPPQSTNDLGSQGYFIYKIKVKSNMQCSEEILNSASIYFDYNAPIFTNIVNTKIHVNTPTSSNSTICAGNFANLNASANGQINWYDGSNNLILNNSNSFTTPSLSTNTSYFVENIENGCTSARTQIDVIVNTTPNAPTSSNSTICAGTTANLNASANGQINWYDGSNNLVLGNSNTYTIPSLSTNTSYFVENIENGCTSARTQIDVIVNTTPNAPTSSNSTICAGNAANLNASANGQINWYDGSNNLIIGNSNSFTTPLLSTNTSYFVENIENGCTSARTQIDVIVIAVPTASFLVNGNDLTASPSGLSYQWLLNGNPINGANSMNYEILQDGIYSVIVTDGTCSDTSATQNVVYMGLNSMISSEIKIFPNPTHGKLYIEVHFEQAKFELYDLNGKLLISKELNAKITNLDLPNIAKGIYLVKIMDVENKIYMQKLVVE